MENRLIITDGAGKELSESFLWYEERLYGLGERFLEVIEKSFRLIELTPERFPIKRKSYREFVVSKFPFVIVYEFIENEKVVLVLHVFHTKRNPKRKYQ
jgi:hypothetical protein